MGNKFEDKIWCDMASMDACHIILGRPWLYDHGMTHQTSANTYTFRYQDKKMTLESLKEDVSTPLLVS